MKRTAYSVDAHCQMDVQDEANKCPGRVRQFNLTLVDVFFPEQVLRNSRESPDPKASLVTLCGSLGVPYPAVVLRYGVHTENGGLRAELCLSP